MTNKFAGFKKNGDDDSVGDTAICRPSQNQDGVNKFGIRVVQDTENGINYAVMLPVIEDGTLEDVWEEEE